MEKKGGDDALHALYAPPAPHPATPPVAQYRFARGAFGAAFRTQRRAPLRALLLLGFLPGLWSLPADVLLDAGQSDGTYLDWAVQLRDAGFALLHALWGAVALGGQTLAALVLASGGRATLRDLVSGVRFAPAMCAISAVGTLWGHALLALFLASAELGGAWAALGLPVTLLLLLSTMVLIMPWSLVCYPVVERRKGVIDAVTRTFDLLRRAWWGFVRLTVLTMLFVSPLVGAGLAESPYVSATGTMLFGPTLFLAWAHAYRRSSAEREGAGPSVGS